MNGKRAAKLGGTILLDCERSLQELLQDNKQFQSFSNELKVDEPMFTQRHMTLKGLPARLAFNLAASIGVRTLVTTEIGELGVGFGTELERRAR